MDFKYRPDIDGLRAIAVLAVLFFHTEVPGFSGGFVGVDIFFVISGYLITSIILKDIRGNRFSIARFYERRIRRIFPALFPVMFFVLAVGAYLYDQSAFKNLGKSITATTLFSSNIFWRESGYFDASSLEKPLLHTWSLAVEEQFYIVFPILLMLIGRYLKGRYLPIVLAAFVLSFGASVYGVAHHPGATFYLVPTRAWELLAGSLLALGVIPDPSSNWVKNFGAFAGMALLAGSIVLYTEATPFPGLAALLPVLGSGLIIHSGMGGGRIVYCKKILSSPPLVFIKLISYSLYLWHWPFVVFWKYLSFKPFGIYDSIAIIMASLLIASISWKFFEQAFRGKKQLLKDRNSLFAVAAMVMMISVGIGIIIYLEKGMAYRYPAEIVNVIDRAKNDPVMKSHRKWEITNRNISSGAIPHIIGDKTNKPSFALVGDSHALSLIPAFELNAIKNRMSGYAITMASTPFLKNIKKNRSTGYENGIDEVEYNNSVILFIENNPQIKTVIISGRWGRYINNKSIFYDSQESDMRLKNEMAVKISLQRSVKTLLSMNRKVVLVTDVPDVIYDTSSALLVNYRMPNILNLESIRPTIKQYYYYENKANLILDDLAKLPGVTIIRSESRIFDDKGNGRIMINGNLLYYDNHHLSTEGAIYIAPIFENIFEEMAQLL